jgi:DNA-binding beta-propeller fold protein YncE
MVKRILLFILLAGVWAHAGVLFVLNSGSETLSRIDTESGVINNSFAALGSLPNRLECDRNFIYVVNSGGNSVQKIAVSDGSTLGNIYLGSTVNPYDLLLTEEFLYVSGGLSNRIYKISLATMQVVDNLLVGNNPAGMAVSGGKLYVGNTDYMTGYSNCSISVIDLEVFEVIQTISASANPQYLLADNGFIHVSCTGNWEEISGKIQIIDTELNEIVHTIDMGGYCSDLAITPGGIIYIADAMNTGIYAYDAASWEVIYSPAAPFTPGGSVVEADDRQIAVLGGVWGQNFTVSLYDLEENFIAEYQAALYGTDMKFLPQPSAGFQQEITEARDVKAYPNPFKDEVNFACDTKRHTPKNMQIYDIKGRLIRKLSNSYWDGKDAEGNPTASGVYLFILNYYDNKTEQVKIIKIR